MAAKKGSLFIVSGPSGAGKTSVVTEALNRLTKVYDMSRIVTYTSRPPRENEVNGSDYHFIPGEEFAQKRRDGFFLETVEYGGHTYGSPVPPVQEMELGKSFVMIVDINGAKSAIKACRDGNSIWIETSSIDVLKQRLAKRGTESAKQIEQRITQAQQEMKEAHKTRLFEYCLINDEFEQAVGEFMLLVKKVLE